MDVEGTDSEEVSPLGYGMLIQGGGSTWEPPVGEVLITGGSVTSARRAGVVVDKTRIAFEGLTVQSTRASLGALGRGIQLQNSVEGSLDAVDVRDNNESGLFVLKPLDVTIRNSVFADTRAGFVFGQAEDVAGGDGLCVTFGEGDPDPTAYRLVLEANTFQENSRVGALAEGVAVVLGDGNVFTGNFLPDETTFPLGDTLFVQHSATVTGPGGEDVVDQVGDLGATSGVELLEVYRGSLDLDSDEEVPN